MSKTKKMILASMLLAIFIILNRFISIKTEILVISFSFIPMMISAIWLLGAILFPFGPYFPGFTVSSTISGLVYGILLYNNGKEMSHQKLFIRLTISSLIHLIVVNIFITSLWIHILYGKAYIAIMASRTITQIIMIPIHIVTIYGLEKFSRPLIKKYLQEEK